MAGDSSVSRRTFLAGLGSVLCAGCSGTNDSRERPYWHLDSEPLYFGSSFDIELPVTVQDVDEPAMATLAVLSGEATVTGDRVVDWLRDGTPVAMTGRPAVGNLQSLLTAGDYRDHFGSNLPSNVGDVYDVAAVAPESDGEWLGTLRARSETDNPVARGLDDVLSGIVVN
jgi:hypothetical protein